MKLEPEWFNKAFPISEVEVYPAGWRVKRSCKIKPHEIPRGLRGEIKQLSTKSLTRLAFTVANCTVPLLSLMTITYPSSYPMDGETVKGHLHKFLLYLKRQFGDVSYIWFIEFQRRGAPHFHILTSLPGPSLSQRAKFAWMWTRVVNPPNWQDQEKMFKVHDHRTAWEAIRKQDGARRYALKYALKPEQKVVPQEYRAVGRFWGTSRDIKPVPMATTKIDEDTLRKALDIANVPVAEWDILPGLIFARDI